MSAIMANKYREEIVGKRFLSVVSGFSKLKLNKIAEWGWRAGVIRAASHKDNTDKDLQVLVEYDDMEWHRREWISIYKDSLFHLFLVEQGLVWSDRKDPFMPTHHSPNVFWPALSFVALVSIVDLSPQHQPVEFLLDQELAFRDFTRIHPFQDWDSSLPGVKRDYPELRQAVRRWAELQDGQRILLATPSVLVGYRVEVYRAEGTTQWYTAVIIGYNEATRELTVTDDTVLEEHNEDPSLVQMRLIGDGVVESIMRGENVGITPRRSRSSTVLNHLHHSLPTSRVSRGLTGGSVSGGNVSGASGGSAAPQNAHVSALTGNGGTRKHRKQQSVAATAAADAATPNSAEQLQIRVAQQHGDILRQDAGGKGTVPTVRNTRKCNKSNENEHHNAYRSRTRSKQNANHSNGQYKERGAAQQRRQQLLQTTVISTAGKQQANRKRNNRNISRKKVLEESNNSKLRNVQIRVEDCLQAKKKPVSNNEESIEQTTERSIIKEDNDEQEVKEEVKVQEEEAEPVAADTVVEEEIVKETAAVCPSETLESEQPAGEDVEREQEQASNRGDNDADGVLVNSGEGVISTSALDETSSGSSVQLVSDEIIVSKQESCNDDDDDVGASASVNEVSVTGSSLLSDEAVVVDNGCSSVSRQEEAAVVEEDVDEEEVDEDEEEEEDDCVIVSEKRIEPRREGEGIEDDRRKHSEQEVGQSAALRTSADRVEYDDGPLASASPLNNRMDLDNNSQSTALLRFADDRSDSGVSSLRSGSCASGDERSGSRSSALSSSDEPPPPSHQSNTRSPLFASEQNASKPQQSAEPVRVWRDPNLLLESEPHVRHIHSVQHQTLLMSHPPPTAPRGEANAPPGSSASHPPAGLYPPPPLLNPYPLHPHPSVLPHHLPLPAADLIWKRYPPPPVGAAHLLGPQPSHQAAEELIERERAYAHDRDRQERLLRERREQEVRDLKERERERERIEREREREKMEREREQREREKADRDRQERLERDKQERERLEIARAAEQAVHKHFEQSLSRLEKRGDRNNISGWNLISSLPPPRGGVVNVEEERKRMEQEHQREQHRQMAAVEKLRHDVRDRTYYSQQTQRPPSVPGKADYPPPPAHSRSSGINKSLDKVPSSHAALPKAEPNFSIFGGYPSYTPGFMTHDPKQRTDHHKTNSGLVTGKTIDNRERDIVGPPPLMSELKNTVIVKHEGKSPHGLEPKVSSAHSPSPKLRVSDMMPHYLSASANQQHKSAGVYEYRSPSQSPHHGMQHHHAEQKVMSHHHRSSNQLPSPHQVHQRQSPHRPPHPSPPESRYQRVVDSAYASAKPPVSVSSYAYPPQQMTGVHYTLPAGAAISASVKPKVSSPALPHVYGKPSPAGIVSGIPVCRTQESMHSSNPIPMNSKLPSVSPSPYQQVSQYPPPQHQQQMMAGGPLPPPAHSSRSTASVPDQRTLYDRIYSGGSVPVKSIPPHHGASPPTGAAAPPGISRSPHQLHSMGLLPPSHHSSVGMSPAVQTQPLDLGVSSDRNPDRGSPKRKGNIMHHPAGSPIALDVKKRRVDSPGSVPPSVQPLQNHPLSLHASTGHPQLARVSEASPLIASAATAITTVVNTAACCTSAASITVAHSQTNEVSIGSPVISITSIPVRNDDCMRPSSAGSSSSIRIPTPASNPPITGGSSSPAPAPSPVPITITTATTACTTTSNSRVPPSTPVKVTLAPSVTDSEKSNSPGPVKSNASSGSYPVRHLKKAWLQRHTGEDVEDNTGVVGSGSCVTLPISINNTVQSNKDSLGSSVTASLHNIGSMAVNSINKKSLSSKGNRKPASSKDTSLNGHSNDSTKADDSSSSDQERGRKSPPKRKPPKVKRKKGGGSIRKTTSEELKKKKTTKESESGSDSDKESMTDKDSDSGASSNQMSAKKGNSSNQSSGQPSNGNKEPRKRGRRPKSSKNDKSEEPRNKKPRGDEQQSTQNPPRDPFRKPPVGQLKKTGESFLQDGPCFEVAPKLAKCRECRWTPNQRSKNMPNIFCRFYAFRRLRYTKNGQLAIAGFSDPHKDATEEDLKLWLPLSDAPPSDLDQDMSRFLLRQVGDQFCDLLVQEKEAHKEHMAEDKTVAWKRVVQGVREMCDVCETTLFNFHWACGKCGFVVCIDCYKSRKNGTVKIWGESGKDRDDFSWLLCTNRQAHEQEKLMLTQIIAGDSLLKLGRKVHETRELFDIPQYCGCPISKEVQKLNGAMKDALKNIKTEPNGIKQEKQEPADTKNLLNGGNIKEENTQNSPLNWLADVALSNEDKKSNSEGSFSGDSDGEEGNFSTLRELLIRPSHKTNGSRASSPAANISSSSNKNTKKSRMDTLDEVISSVIEDSVPKIEDGVGHDIKNMELKHFVRRYSWAAKGRDPLSIRIMTLTESKILYPDTPHSWLCDGKLLRLTDPNHKNNYRIFQDQWKRGQPVIVSDVTRHLDMSLWHPDSFARDFGDDKNDLINCMTGNLVPNQPMRKFWEGFEHFSKRLKDERGNPMLLKLKDWPPGEDFSEILPSRFSDLIKVLPLSEYTRRDGRLNLASRLPECFVRPDLGPKMYNAYGSALHPTKGTTNLHLDISDAVNVMVYVGIPKDGDNEEHIKEAFRAIDEAGCDILTRRRVRDKGELPGALWHIYHARDADKIRDLLNKVALERGARLEPHHDPIHDQSCYLDGPLRERLYKEYGVEGYAIVQCLGDAVFIPAGAPHQVRNLHNCIKVAEDFVSPENVSHCFHLTQEFRALSDTHTNHEDKLQIKNIIYHAVKDSLSVLSSTLEPRVKKEEPDGSAEPTAASSGSSSDTNSSTGSPVSHDADSKDTV